MLTNQLLPLTQGDHYVKRYAETTDEGLLCRHDTRDSLELFEARYWMDSRDMTNHTVLDIGAGIGAFSVLATRRGAKHVQACEPDQSRHAVLRVNADAIPGGVVGALRTGLHFHAGKVSMTWKVDGHVTTQHGIAVLPLSQLCFRKPTFIKMSVHGNELEYLRSPIPAHVRGLLLKTSYKREHEMAKLKTLTAGMDMLREGHKFTWSSAVWYEWRRW